MKPKITYDTLLGDRFLIAYDQLSTGLGKILLGKYDDLETPIDISVNPVMGGIDVAFDPNNINSFVLTYTELDGMEKFKAVVGTVTGTIITLGTPVSVEPDGVDVWDSNIEFVATNKFILTYTADPWGLKETKSIVGTISSGSITFGTPYTLGQNILNPKMVLNGTDQLVIGYYEEVLSGQGALKLVVGNISGDVITYQTPIIVEPDISSVTTIDIAFDHKTSNKFVLFTTLFDLVSTGYSFLVVGNIIGNAITLGDKKYDVADQVEYDIEYGSVAYHPSYSDTFVLSYVFTDTNNLPPTEIMGITSLNKISDTTVTMGTPTIFNSGASYSLSYHICETIFDKKNKNTMTLVYNRPQPIFEVEEGVVLFCTTQ